MKDVLFSYSAEYDVCYSTPERALRELTQRRGNQALCKRVDCNIYFSETLKKELEEPRLILFRQLATPINETLRFLELSASMGLKPLILEYYQDKFVSTSNSFKRGLGKLPIFKFTAGTSHDIFEYKTIVDFNSFTGKKISEVKTLTEETLISRHHALFKDITDIDPKEITIDMSDWFAHYEDNASTYYEPLMTLFLKNGILCENFITTKKEEDFFMQVAKPSIKQVCEKYGLDPLIIRIVDKENEQRLYWDCYPTKVAELF